MAKTSLTKEIEVALSKYKISGGYIWHLPEVSLYGVHRKNNGQYSNRGIVDAVRAERKYKSDFGIKREHPRDYYFILLTCFEIKISVSDFKSRHGHNFIGNKNYYVIPEELYKKVVDSIPENIGVILYKNGSLRQKKECVFSDMKDYNREAFIWNMVTRQSIENKRV